MRKNIRMTVAALAISGAGLIGIATHEGYIGRTYTDIVGVKTIGFGNTDGVRAGQTITVERALIRLGNNISEKEAAMRECIGDTPLYQHEWDSYISLSYNIGTHAFCTSTLVKRLRQSPPDYTAACTEILRWDKAGGKRVLTQRRKTEYKKCMGV